METLSKVNEFLAVSDGWGDGWGDGSGDGWGDGSGDGSGYGSGDGWGDGSGDGSGDGWGDGIKNFCGDDVFLVDGVQTMLDHIRGNVAHGRILRDDLTTEKCYITKQGNLFAHGKTLRDALSALRDKLFDEMPEEERIAEFIKEHPSTDKKYPCRDLWEWHHNLTGSCEMGRNEFVRAHGIDLDKDSMTVKEFIRIAKNAYGGDVIRNLEKSYG